MQSPKLSDTGSHPWLPSRANSHGEMDKNSPALAEGVGAVELPKADSKSAMASLTGKGLLTGRSSRAGERADQN
jgi:hypothetical protein